MLGVGLLLTVGTGFFVASEFALVNLDRADLEARQERGETLLAPDHQRAEDHLDPPVERAARHHPDHAAHRLHDRAGDLEPAARRRSPRWGCPTRGRRRRRHDRRDHGRHAAVDDPRRARAEELRPRAPAADRQARHAVPGRRSPPCSSPSSRCSTAAPTASCARSASSRRRSSPAPAPPRSSRAWCAARPAQGVLERDTATLLDRTLALLRPHRRRRHDAAPAASHARRRAATPPRPCIAARPPHRLLAASRSIDEDIDDIVGIVHLKQAVAVPARAARRGPGRGARDRAAARARDDAARHPARRAARRAATRWPSSSTSTAAPPASSPSRTSSRSSSARSLDEHDRRRAGVVRAADWLTFPGELRPDELLERTGIRVPEDDVVRDGRRLHDERARAHPRRRRHGRGRGRHAPGASAWTAAASTACGSPRADAATTRRPSGVTTDERLGGNRLAGRAAGGQRLLRRRRVRRHLRPPLADRAARRGGLARRQDRAVRDGARDAHAGDEPARHHHLLAADPERVRAGDPPPAGGAARPAPAGRRRSIGTIAFVIALRRGVVPARRVRRDGAEEPRRSRCPTAPC